jgi:riboflavin kinase / FMN adenylyltransferase
METIHFSDLKKRARDIVLGIGKFDGIHSGHRAILKAIVKKAEKGSHIPAVFTFRKFPVNFFICGWEEKLALLEKAGIELCVWCDFEEISQLGAESFLNMLSSLNVSELVVGSNFRFGAERKGNISMLKTWQEKKIFRLTVVPPEKISGNIINSTKIRDFIRRGDIVSANAFLGRCLSVKGRVLHGKKIGTHLGFPTANMFLFNDIHIAEGIYAGRVKHGNLFYGCAVSIGPSPTFEDREKKFEVFFIGFKGDLYGKTLEVYLMKKVRDIKKFKGAEQLKLQISKDIKAIRDILAANLPEQK